MSGRQPVPCDAVPMDTPERSRRVVDFRLANGEQIHAAHPETFEIPPRSQRETLQPGDLAKLLFAVMEPSGDEPSAERMWVMVRQVIGGRYVGSLDNEPRAITTIAADDPVEFGPEHVIQIWEDE